MSNKDEFALWFEANNFGEDMWQDFRKCHKEVEKLQQQLAEANEVIVLVEEYGSNNLPEGKQNVIGEYKTKWGEK